MSQNIQQIFLANPITTNASTDLMYFGQSPYGAGDDAAMTFVDFNEQIVAPGTANQVGYYATSGNKISPITAANNGVLITSNTGIPSWLANSGTPGFILTANSGAPPSWQVNAASGTVTSGLINQLTWYAATGTTVSGLATANSSALVTNGSGVPAWQAMAAGQILIGTTAGAPIAAAINSGTGIVVANGSGSITVNATGGGFATATIAGTTQIAVVSTKYIALNVAQTTVTLPAVYAVGDVVALIGSTANTGGWVLTAAAGDTIRVNNATTSAGGTVTCTAVAGQCIEVVCDVANTSWVMTSTSSVLLTTA